MTARGWRTRAARRGPGADSPDGSPRRPRGPRASHTSRPLGEPARATTSPGRPPLQSPLEEGDDRAAILLVDDRPENLLALEAVLEPLGQRLLRATSGDEGLKCLLHDDVAVILLDVQMPGLDGFQTAAHIKKRERTRHIPIIFLTAISSEPRHIARGYATGAVDYITKPFDPAVLRSKVAVFVDLYRKNKLLSTQADLLEQRLREKEAAEAALVEKTAELQRSNAELEQFASVASHDLSAPLRTATGYLHLLAADHRERLGPDGVELVDRSLRLLGDMRELIDDLLACAVAGTRELSREVIDLDALMQEVLRVCAASIEASGATVVVDPLPTLRGDRMLLGLVLQNLIANAVKFVAPGTLPRVHVQAERTPRAWCVSVADNGIGIPPAEREAVFDMFRRLHGVDEYAGTGVGLTSCRRIVERHGGRIWVEEGTGGGSVLRFSLPDDPPSR